MKADMCMTKHYVAMLTGDSETPMTWQLLHGGAIKPPMIIHGSVSDSWDRLTRFNDAGYGIYVTVNETDLRGRKAENITAIRAFFVDIDDGRRLADISPHVAPSFVVSSGRGDHLYWVIERNTDLDVFTRNQKKLIGYYSSDKAIHDLPRVMRAPGLIYDKGGKRSIVTISEGSDAVYGINKVTAIGEDRALDRSKHMAAASYARKAEGRTEGGRNEKGFTLACKHARFGLSANEMMPYMQGWNLRNSPPLSPEELSEIVSNAERYGKETPADNPNRSESSPIAILPRDFPGLRAPPRYSIDMSGVWHEKKVSTGEDSEPRYEHVLVCPEPIVITKYIKDADVAGISLEVSWFSGGRWHRAVEKRDVFMNKNKVVSMALHGMPVHSDNARRIMLFLDAFERENSDVIAIEECSSQMGWVGNKGFLCGKKWITENKSRTNVSFHGEEHSDEFLARSICASGEFSEWRDVFISEVSRYPRVAIAAYASLAPVIMNLIDAPGFAVDWSYRTSSGKTTTMRIAASVWGNADERGGSIIGSWDSTQVYIERRAAMFNGIPLILDESKRVRWPNMVPNVIYMVANGQGRGRGKKSGGVQSLKRFRTVLLSTGEQRLTDFSRDGGLATRVVSFWGSPFGETSDDTKESIDKINGVLRGNYGHAGPMFAEWVVNNTERVLEVAKRKSEFEDDFKRVVSSDIDSGISFRLAEYIAVLRITEELVMEAFKLPWASAAVYASMSHSAENLDSSRREHQALEHVLSWGAAREQLFRGREGSNTPSRYLGVWKNGGDMCWHKDAIVQALSEGGFDVESTLRLWGELGVIKSNAGSKTTRMVKYDGKNYRLVCIGAQLVGDSAPEDDDDDDLLGAQPPQW